MSKDRVVKLLVVNVVDINAEAMRRANTPMYTSQDIIRMTMVDKLTWDIFQNGWTQGINQCQSASTTEKLMLYKPKQLRDLSSFVAAIRPGFKSMLSKFLHRESFSYAVESFDAILRNDSTRSSWMLYQENIMAVLGLAGFTMVESYPVIKAISKKKLKVIASAKERFLEGFKQYIIDNENIPEAEAAQASEDVWKVIIDSASYSFNASHSVCVSLDALYGAYLKAHYPMEYYSTLLDHYSNKGNKDKVTLIKQEMRKAYGIEIVPCKFRQDNRSFYMDKEKMQMANALHSVKYISRSIANELYKMKDMKFNSFIDMLCILDNNRAFNSRSINILIMMGYFEEFGSKGKLLALYDEFCNGKNKITKTLKDATRSKRISILYEMENAIEDTDIPAEEQIYFEAQHYGTPISTFKTEKGKYIVIEVETKYTPKAKLYSISTGNVGTVKILKKDFIGLPFDVGDILTVKHYRKKPAYSFSNGERIIKKGVHECWIDSYDVKHIDKEEAV